MSFVECSLHFSPSVFAISLPITLYYSPSLSPSLSLVQKLAKPVRQVFFKNRIYSPRDREKENYIEGEGEVE